MIRHVLDTVRLDARTPALAWMLLVLMADEEALVLTSGSDSFHHPHSAHYRGEAVDIRSHDLGSTAEKRVRQARLLRALGSEFVVLLEPFDVPGSHAPEHLHLQLKRGMAYPDNILGRDVGVAWTKDPPAQTPPVVA